MVPRLPGPELPRLCPAAGRAAGGRFLQQPIVYQKLSGNLHGIRRIDSPNYLAINRRSGEVFGVNPLRLIVDKNQRIFMILSTTLARTEMGEESANGI
jgi:hypothetical protein